VTQGRSRRKVRSFGAGRYEHQYPTTADGVTRGRFFSYFVRPRVPLSWNDEMMKLTDTELEIVFAAARPLEVNERVAFMQEVAEALGRLPQLGDGIVHRTVADVQRRHRDAPLGKTG
jgi:hypothetical protein